MIMPRVRGFLNFYAIIDYVFDGGAGVELPAADFAGVDPVAEEGSRRGAGVRRRHDRRAVRRGVWKRADEADEVCGGDVFGNVAVFGCDECAVVSFGHLGGAAGAGGPEGGGEHARASGTAGAAGESIYAVEPEWHEPVVGGASGGDHQFNADSGYECGGGSDQCGAARGDDGDERK